MKFKLCPALVKTAGSESGDGDDGTFEAFVSVFNNVDSVGDIVKRGAFTDCLTAWTKSPSTLPVLWSHRMDDPRFNIGAVLAAEEVHGGDKRIPEHASAHLHAHGGLWVKGVIDSGPDASDVAVHTRRLLKARRVTQFSYAYDALDEGPDDDGHNELRRLWVHEISTTQVGANQLTELVGAKHDDPGDQDPPATRRPGMHPDLYRLRCDLAAAALL